MMVQQQQFRVQVITLHCEYQHFLTRQFYPFSCSFLFFILVMVFGQQRWLEELVVLLRRLLVLGQQQQLALEQQQLELEQQLL